MLVSKFEIRDVIFGATLRTVLTQLLCSVRHGILSQKLQLGQEFRDSCIDTQASGATVFTASCTHFIGLPRSFATDESSREGRREILAEGYRIAELG